jgi:hypothetical protein
MTFENSNDDISLGRHHFPEPWEKDANDLTGTILTAHLPNGLFFETGDESFIYVGSKVLGSTETLHFAPHEIRELGVHLVKMAEMIEYREDRAQMAQWSLEDRANRALSLVAEA